MKSLNKVQLIGHVGGDPELRHTPSGTPVATFSMATSEKWKDKQTGEDKERTDWHTVVAWSKLGEISAEIIKKGMPVYVEGKLRLETYEKDGQKHYRTKVQAMDIIFLGSRPETAEKQAKPAKKAEPEDNFDDDIPF